MQKVNNQRDGNPASASPILTIQVFESFEAAQCHRVAWDELVGRTCVEIYQTFDWCRIWWRHYGKGRRLQLLLGFSCGRLVAVLPTFVEVLWLGPVRIRVAKLVGSDFSLQLCNPPIEQGFSLALIESAIYRFFTEFSCDLLLLGPLSGPKAQIDEFLATAQQMQLVQTAESLGSGCATRFELPSEFKEYMTEIGSRQRSNYIRAMKQLAKSSQIKTDVISSHDEACEELERFIALHGDQWRLEGKLGHFDDWPGALAFNRDLVDTMSSMNMVRFFRILVDDVVASSQFCFVYGGVNYWRLPARSCQHDWKKLSLGKVGLVKMVEDSIGEGVVAIEGGRGHYEYKVQLAGREWPLRSVQIMRNGMWVRTRVGLFRVLSRGLHFLYYRLFFTRLAPWFPWFRGPLWSTWIRSTW